MHHFVSTIVAISYQNELTPLLAKEDCEARRIVKNETQWEEGISKDKPREDTEEGPVDDEEETKDSDDDDDIEEESGNIEKESGNITTSKFFGGETYAQRRERNIAENKKLLDELKAKYPVRDPKKVEIKNKGCVSITTCVTIDTTNNHHLSQTASATNLINEDSAGSPALAALPVAPADVENLEIPSSTSHNSGEDRTVVSQIEIHSTNLPASPVLADPPITKEPVSARSPASSPPFMPADIESSETPSSNTGEDHTVVSQNVIDSTNLPVPPVLTDPPVTKEPDSYSSSHTFTSSNTEIETPCANSADQTSNSFKVMGEDGTNSESSPLSEKVDTDVVMQDMASSTGTQINEKSPLSEKVDTDVVMQDTDSSTGTQIDENLPSWLTQMILHLRQVSDRPAWQDLVSGFVEFENCGPPTGVSSCWMSMGTD